MRSGNTLKIITAALIVLALMSATAFAAVGQPDEKNLLSEYTYSDNQ